MPIDTLKASKRLKALGFTEEQAEGVAELLNETDAASATKDDLYALEGRLDERFERIDERFERIDDRFEQIDSRFKQVDDRFDTLQADINERFELQSTRIDERFNAQNARIDALKAEFKNYVTSRVAWAAGLLALYITLANYLMG
jgi:chaperonin cofactor prefoldin